MLQSRREEPAGIHLPESVVTGTYGIDPENEALLADSIGSALLVILHTLAPAERLAFVLHDMFAGCGVASSAATAPSSEEPPP